MVTSVSHRGVRVFLGYKFSHCGFVGSSFVDPGSLCRVRIDMVIPLVPRVVGASSVVRLFVGEMFIMSSVEYQTPGAGWDGGCKAPPSNKSIGTTRRPVPQRHK